MTAINIGNRLVGPGHPAYLVAELGINHDGKLRQALQMVRAAADAGADAVKVQAFSPECFVSKHATYKGESQEAMFSRYVLPDCDIRDIAHECMARGVEFFGTPDCVSHAQLLLELGAPVLKVGSDDLTNLPLIEALAKMGKPLILSTGMADEQEIMDAYEEVTLELGYPAEDGRLMFMHCVSLYPCPPDKANLQRIRAMPGEVRGFSDHTDGIDAAVCAVAIGANVIEKHFTLDRSLPGPDHAFSADPAQFRDMVQAIRRIEPLIGIDWEDGPSDEEKAMRIVARRSIRSRFDSPAGTLLTRGHLVFQRPGDGLGPAELDKVLGRSLCVPKAAGDKIAVEDVR
jgi:N,N'-diacetyllegionaminate synthase